MPPPDVLSGRDVELLGAGVVCAVGAGIGLLDDTVEPVLPGLLLLVGAVSIGLAWWDVRTRGSGATGPDDESGSPPG